MKIKNSDSLPSQRSFKILIKLYARCAKKKNSLRKLCNFPMEDEKLCSKYSTLNFSKVGKELIGNRSLTNLLKKVQMRKKVSF